MALHYATAKSRQQALLKWMRQSPRIPQCKRFLKMFLPPSSGSVILSLARLRTLDRAFSSGGERFPDTEEVRSSNLLTPTKCSQLRGYVSSCFVLCRQISWQLQPPKQPPCPYTKPRQRPKCLSRLTPQSIKTAPIVTEAETNTSRTHPSRNFSAKRRDVCVLRYP